MKGAVADSSAPMMGTQTHRKSMRVLMGVPSAGATGGGPALHLPMLVEDLRAAGIDVHTFAYGRWAEDEGRWRKVGHQIADLARFPARLRRARPDVLHLNSALDRRALVRDTAFSLVAWAHGVPVLVKWHGGFVEILQERASVWRAVAALFLRTTAAIAMLSTEERDAVTKRRPRLRCFVVSNGLDLARYVPRTDPRSQLGVPAGAALLLFISRLIPTKGLLDLIEAMPEIVQKSGAHLVVVGDGPVAAPAKERVRAQGLVAHVHFMGAVSETEALDYYRGCDLLVFPTFHPEGFPMAVFQSLAAGMGIVATRVRAIADHLREPDNVVFIPPRDPAALSRAVVKLLDEPDTLASMRAANLTLAKQFDRTRVSANFETIYEQLRRRPPQPSYPRLPPGDPPKGMRDE